MLKARLIARLDIKGPDLIKTVHCEGVRKLGDPAEFAERYNEAGIDELLYMDVVASLYGRNSLAAFIERASADAYCPVTVGGGIRSVDDAMALFRAGADKVAVNTAAIRRPELINELALKFGSQAVVLQIDAKQKGDGWEAYCDGARQPTGRDVAGWASDAVNRGAGEVFVTSIDREGTGRGMDRGLVRAMSKNIGVPLVASGGAGVPMDAVGAIKAGASGVAIAGLLHYNRATVSEIKEAMVAGGIPTRLEAA